MNTILGSPSGSVHHAKTAVAEALHALPRRRRSEDVAAEASQPQSRRPSTGSLSLHLSAPKWIKPWTVDALARALSKDNLEKAGRELKDAIRRVPYHGLWAGAEDFRDQHSIVYAQIGQDLVRSFNATLGQYATAEQLGGHLRHAYRDACRQAHRAGIAIKLLGQEYNMAFFCAYRPLHHEQAHRLQQIFNDEVWRGVHKYVAWVAEHIDGQQQAVLRIEQQLDVRAPLINLGFAKAQPKEGKTALERLARTAIAASAAAKRARGQAEGYAFADAQDILSALERYQQLLSQHQGLVCDQEPLVVLSPQNERLLNPRVLVRHRAKQLASPGRELVAEAVGLLNCLDWVQQSRYTDLPLLAAHARDGRQLLRGLGSQKKRLQKERLTSFVLQHVPYLAVARAMLESNGTLYWVDMKKLAVRCHMLREAEARRLLAQAQMGPVGLSRIIDAMVAIDLQVQDARDELLQAHRVIGEFMQQNGDGFSLTHHVGGDDAAFFLTQKNGALQKDLADRLGRQLSVRTANLRIAYCNVAQGADVAEELCRIDRLLTATKLD